MNRNWNSAAMMPSRRMPTCEKRRPTTSTKAGASMTASAQTQVWTVMIRASAA